MERTCSRRTSLSRPRPFLICLLAAAVGTWSVPSQAAEEPQAAPQKASAPGLVDRSHPLGPGDVVEITVVGFAELSRTVKLLADGSFDYPLLGTVDAAGLTVKELVDRITEGLKIELREPLVSGSLKEMYVQPKPVRDREDLPKITVLGAVGKKGQLELSEPKPLRTLLAELGPTEKADLSRIRIRYPDGTARQADFSRFHLTGEAKDDVTIRGGEEIFVLERQPEKPKEPTVVRIAGQVQNPTIYELKPGMTVEDLILAAGKLTTLANVNEVELRRKNGEHRTLNLVKQHELGIEGLVRLEPGDEVFIPEQKNTLTLIGAVPAPGLQALTPGQTVRDFFLAGQGGAAAALNPATVDLKGVELIRQGKPVRKLDLRSILKKAQHPDNVALQSGDVLFVPPRAQQTGRPGGILGFLQQLGPLAFLFGAF